MGKYSSPAPIAPRQIDPAWVDAIAHRVAELMRRDGKRLTARLVDAATLAAELGVERSWVYEHRDELGAIRLGSGTKPRLRFDIVAVRAAVIDERPDLLRSPGSSTISPTHKRQRPKREPAVGRVLSVRTRP